MRLGSLIEQDDVLYETSTPRELFQAAAQFRTCLTQKEIDAKVDTMIHTLGLKDCQHRMVGGMFIPSISGGERKRTSIGVELITNPRVILLDEPTSGLDASNALKLIQLLKKEAKLRKAIVVCSIHQPSSEIVQRFDRVVCLSDGYTIYNGPTHAIAPYFEQQFGVKMKKYTNPADFLIKISH